MSLVRELASSPLLADPGADKHGKVVFFDVLGLLSVVYPERIAIIVNSLTVLASGVSLYFGIAHNKKQLGGCARTLLDILFIYFSFVHSDKPSLWMVLKAVGVSDLLAGCYLH